MSESARTVQEQLFLNFNRLLHFSLALVKHSCSSEVKTQCFTNYLPLFFFPETYRFTFVFHQIKSWTNAMIKCTICHKINCPLWPYHHTIINNNISDTGDFLRQLAGYKIQTRFQSSNVTVKSLWGHFELNRIINKYHIKMNTSI